MDVGGWEVAMAQKGQDGSACGGRGIGFWAFGCGFGAFCALLGDLVEWVEEDRKVGRGEGGNRGKGKREWLLLNVRIRRATLLISGGLGLIFGLVYEIYHCYLTSPMTWSDRISNETYGSVAWEGEGFCNVD